MPLKDMLERIKKGPGVSWTNRLSIETTEFSRVSRKVRCLDSPGVAQNLTGMTSD